MFWYPAGMTDPRSLSQRLGRMPSGRHLVPSDFVTQNQRERMLLATAELVAERGYQKTTIESIAKTARVALVTFYEQFESKEECFLAAFDESVAAAVEIFGELLDRERPWPDQIASGLEIFLEMVVSEPARARLCIIESQAAGTAALARYQATLELVGGKLREGRALNSKGAQLPDGLEVAIVGGLSWLVQQRLEAGRGDDLKALLPEMLQIVLTPFVGEADAGRAAEAAQARMVA